MTTEARFTPAQVKLMCDLMDDHGLTAREVGEKFGITRNAVIALRYRAGRAKAKQHDPLMAGKNQTPSKPCLRCGSNAPRDPVHRICDNCKNSDVFGGMYGAY